MKRMSKTTTYLLIICVFLLTANISLGYVLTRQSDAAMRIQIENRMLDVSNTAAAMLDGDYLEVMRPEDEGTPEYENVLKTLSYFQDNIELSYIYCIRDMGDGKFAFTIDPSDDPGEFGEPIARTDALYRASQGTASVDKEPYRDRWGRFYSAYTPVFNSRHQVSGIVAVDFSAEWYANQISDQISTTLLVSVISLFIAGAIIFILAERSRKQFQSMLGEMNAISDGIETLVQEMSPGVSIKLHKEEKRDSSQEFSGDEITELGNRIRSLQNQLGDQIAFVRSRAYIDSLTGLGNRTAYEERVNEIDNHMKEGTADFTVALFDMNGLKEINDHLGHEEGDRAIIKVAAALAEVFGDNKPYRIGGDEFAVILEGSYFDIQTRFDHVDKILEEKKGPTTAKGYALYSPDTDMGYREVFRRADAAMYEDKKTYYLNHDRRKNE